MLYSVLWTLGVIIKLSYGCSCGESVLHQQVCDSEFIIRGKVNSEKPGLDINDFMSYNVTILETLKNKTPNELPVTYSVRIYTPGNDGICRVPLTIGDDYYLGGTFKPTGRLLIQLCGFWGKSSILKDCEKRMIYNNAFDCSCKDPSCFQSC